MGIWSQLMLFWFRGFDSVLAVMNDFDMEKNRFLSNKGKFISLFAVFLTIISSWLWRQKLPYVTLVTLWNNSIRQYCIVRNSSGISDTCVLTCLWVKVVTLTKLERLIMKNLSNQWFEDSFSQLLDFRSLFKDWLLSKESG